MTSGSATHEGLSSVNLQRKEPDGFRALLRLLPVPLDEPAATDTTRVAVVSPHLLSILPVLKRGRLDSDPVLQRLEEKGEGGRGEGEGVLR